MTPIVFYVLLFIAPYGQLVSTTAPREFATLAACDAEAERRNAEIRATYRPKRKSNSLIEYVCEVRS